jgi:uncharacterized membrane protein
LFLLMCAGAFLRFKGLTFQSYWNDELFSAFASDPDSSLGRVIKNTVRNVHPPLYQVLLWAWYKIFGYTEFAGRSLSVLAGTLLIPAMYILGKELFDRRVGFYAALISTFNYYLIYYSQEARSYSLLVLLIVVCFVFFVRLLRTQNRINLVGYIASILAVVYTHYYGLLIFASQMACLLTIFLSRDGMSESLRNYSLQAFKVITVLSLPLLPFVIRTSSGTGLSWIKQPGPWFFTEYLQKHLLTEHLAYMFGFFLVLGVIRLCRSGGRAGYLVPSILGFWVVFIYLVPYLRGLFFSPMLHERYAIAGLPALIILAAAGISFIKRVYIRYPLLAFFSLTALFSLYHTGYYEKVSKQQNRELLRDLTEINVSGMPVYGVSPERFNAYLKKLGLPPYVKHAGKKLEELLTEKNAGTCFWLIGWDKRLRQAADIMDRYPLHMIGKIEKRQVAAILISTQGPDSASCPEINNTGALILSKSWPFVTSG